MNINVYAIKSLMRQNELINEDSSKLLNALKEKLSVNFTFISSFDKNSKDLVLILVQSGGSEAKFINEIYPNYPGPYYLLTYGSNNSLAASLEILSFIKENKLEGEVLHGSIDYISKRILVLITLNKVVKEIGKLGVFGTPSDWLIASNVDYKKARRKLGIELVDIKEEEVIKAIKEVKIEKTSFINKGVDQKELDKAYQIYYGLKLLVNKYKLDGFTIRCFDLIPIFKMSPCLPLAYFNKDGIIAGCEGDIPSMITMFLVLKKLGVHSFMANPQIVDIENNIVEFAHCTLPLDMVKDYEITTHYESQIGLAIHSEFELDCCTVVKISPSIEEYFLEEGKIEESEYRYDRCRTQVRIKLDSNSTYFLKNPLGNHHIIILGHHKKDIKEYFDSLNLKEVKF